ncbi:MAG: glutamine-hydrolyzing GMP synthase, partial [Elusimicrobia bacterium]|nr:glutamine-hydrolyzing GMP synthase [Elusimicrobiota bacterium]
MILILDFGSQYTQLIARRIREAKVYCEIHPGNRPIHSFGEINKIRGIILSGGPSSVYEEGAPWPDEKLWELNIPILGICYGMQLIAEHFGGKVKPSGQREYGVAQLSISSQSGLFKKLPKKMTVWMSHGDHLSKIPGNFKKIAHTANSQYAAIADLKKNMYGVQFHPEVKHTPFGKKILENFVFNVCKVKKDWSMHSFVENETKKIREQVGEEKVICALSGGVDSSVAATMVHKALGKQLTCIFVDNGVLRL